MDERERPSAQLLEANERLLKLRAEIQARRGDLACENGQPADTQPRLPEKSILSLASINIGWESEPVTAHLRQIEARRQEEAAKTKRDQEFAAWQQQMKMDLVTTAHRRDTVAIFGHTLDVIGRSKKVSCGRVWMVARYLDKSDGCGRIPVALLRTRLVDEWQLLSWKRLRQVMNDGEGIFWHRDEGQKYLYYHSEARVAAYFGVKRLRGYAVEIPVKELLGDIQQVRAIFYDAFHSARGDGYGKPITRWTLENRGSGDCRTQRTYEELRGMKTKANYLNVALYSKSRWMWEKGREVELDLPLGPAFKLVDYNGRLGRNPLRRHRRKSQQHWHNIYIMRRMANSYAGTLRTVKRGKRWTNHKLKHLCHSMLITGSDEESETVHIYHETEKRADWFCKKKRKSEEQDAYYPQSIAQMSGESTIWRTYGGVSR